MKGRRVRLRPITPDDAAAIVAWTEDLQDDASAAAAVAGSLTQSVTTLERELGDGSQTMMMILDPKDEPVGILEWHWVGGLAVRSAEVGVTVGVPGLWTLGYGADAFDTLMSHLFLVENAHRVQFSVRASNLRMIKALTTLGAPVLEGIRREAAYVDGEYDDILLFSILRREFDDVLEVAPDLAERLARRRALQDESRRLLRDHLSATGDSAVQHLVSGVVPDPLAGRDSAL